MDEEAGFLADDGHAGPLPGSLCVDRGQGQGAGEVPGLWLRIRRTDRKVKFAPPWRCPELSGTTTTTHVIRRQM